MKIDFTYDREKKQLNFIDEVANEKIAEISDACDCLSDEAHCLAIEATERLKNDGLATVFENNFMNHIFNGFKKIVFGHIKEQPQNFKGRIVKYIPGGTLKIYGKKAVLNVSYYLSEGNEKLADMFADAGVDAAEYFEELEDISSYKLKG